MNDIAGGIADIGNVSNSTCAWVFQRTSKI